MATNLIWMAAGLAIGVVLFFIFCAILAKLAAKYTSDEPEGDLIISDDDEVYARFGVPIDDIRKSKTVRLVVKNVKTRKD